jgi:hypothetical protein
MSELKLCTWIRDDTERLACFDQVTQSLQSNAAVAEIKDYPTPQSTIETKKEKSWSLFGFLPGKNPAQKSVDNIDVTIIKAQENSLGRWILQTDDGQVWQQTSAKKIKVSGLPFTASIEKSRLGSYWMEFGSGHRATRLKVSRLK